MSECTPKFLEMVKALKKAKFEFESLKPYFLAQCILECGRGSTKLFADFSNPFGMHYHDFMKEYATGVEYDACDGKAIYAKFANWDNVFKAYFAWFSEWSHYGDWKAAAAYGGEAFLKHIGPHYCPPGFTAEWAKNHDGLNYADYICKKLLPEARKLLTDVEEPVGPVTWYKTFGNPNDKSWHTFCAMDGAGNCIAKLDAGNMSDLVSFAAKYGSHTIRRGLDNEVPPPVKDSPKPIEKTEWIPFATKIDKMPRRKEAWPTYFIIHWTAGEPSQKGEDGIAEGAKNGYTYLFLERTGKLFQGAPTNQGGYHAGNASVSSLDCLGVEVACAGKVEKVGELYVPWFAKNSDGSVNKNRCIPAPEIVYDKDDTTDDGSFAGYYQLFTPQQQNTLLKLALYAVQVLGIKVENIRGHDEIATPHGRKVDPGFSIGEGGMVQFRKDVAKLIAQGKTWLDFDKPSSDNKPVAIKVMPLNSNLKGALTMGTVGIKETTDVLVAANKLALSIVRHLKDGFQITDLIGIFTEAAGPLKDAVDGCSQIPKEVADIDLQEGMSLLETQIKFIPEYLAALTK